MEVVTEESEERLTEFLPFVAETPASWMSVYLNMASINGEALNTDGLSRQVLDGIHRISLQLAQKIHTIGQHMEGRIFVFEDSDILVVFLSEDETSSADLIKKLNHEFVSKQLTHILHVHPMKDRLDSLINLSKNKLQSAQDIKLKKWAINIGENIFSWTSGDARLTNTIKKMRRQRTAGVILVIDDDLIVRGLIASALKKEYKIVQARDAKSGITAYVNNAPNMVLLDIHLPDHNGRDVLNRIKLLDPEAYVVMLSADSVADNVVASLSEGSVGFIKKPFSLDKLLVYIDKCQTLGTDAKTRALGWSTMASPFKIK